MPKKALLEQTLTVVRQHNQGWFLAKGPRGSFENIANGGIDVGNGIQIHLANGVGPFLNNVWLIGQDQQRRQRLDEAMMIGEVGVMEVERLSMNSGRSAARLRRYASILSVTTLERYRQAAWRSERRIPELLIDARVVGHIRAFESDAPTTKRFILT